MERRIQMTKEEALEKLRMYNSFGINDYIYRNHRGEYCRKKVYDRYSPSFFENNEILKDKDFMAEAIKINGNILEIADENIRYDKDLLLMAVKNTDILPWCIELPEYLLSDEKFMTELLCNDGNFLWQVKFNYATPFTEVEKNFIKAAVSNNYQSCKYVYLELIFNFHPECIDFAYELLAINAMTLRYFGQKLRGDEKIVLKAIEYSYRSYEFASNRLRNDEEFVLRVLEINPSCLAYAPRRMREDRELVMRLMKIDPFVYRYAKGEMENDPRLALEAVKGAPHLYDFLSFKMMENQEFLIGLEEYIDDEKTDQMIKERLRNCLETNNAYRRLKGIL